MTDCAGSMINRVRYRSGLMIRMSAAIVLLLPLLAQASAPETLYDLGRGRYDRGEYRVAVEYLENSVRLSPQSSDYHLWLGMAYGRLAQKLPWYQAIDYAEKSAAALKRAVDLNGRNIRALRTLAEFYAQAPVFLGGSSAKAAELRARADALQEQ